MTVPRWPPCDAIRPPATFPARTSPRAASSMQYGFGNGAFPRRHGAQIGEIAHRSRQIAVAQTHRAIAWTVSFRYFGARYFSLSFPGPLLFGFLPGPLLFEKQFRLDEHCFGHSSLLSLFPFPLFPLFPFPSLFHLHLPPFLSFHLAPTHPCLVRRCRSPRPPTFPPPPP